MWRCTPMTTPPGNSAFGCAGAPRLASAALKASMLELGHRRGAKRHVVQSVFAGPGRAYFARRRIPEWRVGLLQRAQRDRARPYSCNGRFYRSASPTKTGTQTIEGVDENIARSPHASTLVKLDLRRHDRGRRQRRAAVAQMIEHADSSSTAAANKAAANRPEAQAAWFGDAPTTALR